MKTYRRWFQNFLAGSAFIIAALSWIFFAPTAAGGQTSYVIINGNSMEPKFHTGDLVIVRESAQYRLGDAVTYRDPDLDSFVFHRIIQTNLNHYIFKGDNNSWVDSYQPSKEELVGKLWIHIPGAGKIVRWVRLPLSMALIVGGIGGIFMAPEILKENKKPSKSKKTFEDVWIAFKDYLAAQFLAVNLKLGKAWTGIPKPNLNKPGVVIVPSQPENPDENARHLGTIFEGGIFTIGLLFFTSIVAAFFAFKTPLLRTVQENLLYQHAGVFSYSASAPSGVYDIQAVRTGEPLFPKLTCQVNLNFNYQLIADQIQNPGGTHQMTALVMDRTSGWQRSLQLEPPTPFTGNSFSSNAVLDICQVIAMTEQFESLTEIRPNNYSLAIVPLVEINGGIDQADLKSTFDPRLVFQFDKLHFFIQREDAKKDPLFPLQAGMLQNTRVEPNTLQFLGISTQVSQLRVASAIGLLVSVLGTLLMGIYFSQMARQSQAAVIRVKYGSMLVDVKEQLLNLPMHEVSINAIDDLAKLAERHNSVILHFATENDHDYLVQADQIVYHYSLNDMDGSAVVISYAQNKRELLQAIENNEFKVYYQPIVSLVDRKIIGVEALLRWQHPENGLVPANEFILTAEKTGLIDKLGEWMLQIACQQIKTWQEAGVPLKLAVNLSQRQLERAPDRVIANALQNTGLGPDALQVEVSESNAFNQRGKAYRSLQEINKLGIHISVDDYSGNYPFSPLEEQPFDTLKIDRKVLQKVNNPNDAQNVHSMISSAISQGINVIAEGVETEEQLNFLSSNLCPQAQGYLLGRPAPAEELTLVLLDQEISSPILC